MRTELMHEFNRLDYLQQLYRIGGKDLLKQWDTCLWWREVKDGMDLKKVDLCWWVGCGQQAFTSIEPDEVKLHMPRRKFPYKIYDALSEELMRMHQQVEDALQIRDLTECRQALTDIDRTMPLHEKQAVKYTARFIGYDDIYRDKNNEDHYQIIWAHGYNWYVASALNMATKEQRFTTHGGNSRPEVEVIIAQNKHKLLVRHLLNLTI